MNLRNTLSSLSIVSKMRLVVIVVLVLLVLIGYLGNLGLSIMAETTNNMYRHPFTVSNAVREIKTHKLEIEGLLKDLILLKEDADVSLILNKIQQNDLHEIEDFKLIKQRYLGDLSDVELAEKQFTLWRPIREEIIQLVRKGEFEQAKFLYVTKGIEHSNSTQQAMDALLEFANDKAQQFLNKANQTHENTQFMYSLMLLLIGMGLSLVANRMIRGLAPPIIEIADRLKKLSLGNIDFKWQKSSRKDEIGLIENCLYDLRKSTSKLSKIAQSYAYGLYEQKVTPRSNEDVLGHSMLMMSEYLQSSSFITQGTSKLNDAIIGDKSLDQLTHDMLTVLSNHTQTNVASLYIVQQQGGLLREAVYALDESYKKEVLSGADGVLGEAMQTQQAVALDNIQLDHLKINSALGEASLHHVNVFPIIWNKQVIALLEFGRLKAFTEQQQDFIQSVMLTLAVSLKTAINRDDELMAVTE